MAPRMIDPDFLATIRDQLLLVSERALADHNRRMANLDADGIPPKVEANEAEAWAWKRALEWVLREATKK